MRYAVTFNREEACEAAQALRVVRAELMALKVLNAKRRKVLTGINKRLKIIKSAHHQIMTAKTE